MDIATRPDFKSQSPDKHNVGILLFDGVEVLDFAGPFEVFSRTRLVPGVESRRSEANAPFWVFTVAKKGEPITATGDLQLTPRYSFQTAPPMDVLVVPGGYGTRVLKDEKPLKLVHIQLYLGTRQIPRLETGNDGTFTLDHLAPGKYRLLIQGWGTTNLKIRGANRGPINLPLWQFASWNGCSAVTAISN